MIAVVTMFATQVAIATSWRINYDTTKGAHFTSINDAATSTPSTFKGKSTKPSVISSPAPVRCMASFVIMIAANLSSKYSAYRSLQGRAMPRALWIVS